MREFRNVKGMTLLRHITLTSSFIFKVHLNMHKIPFNVYKSILMSTKSILMSIKYLKYAVKAKLDSISYSKITCVLQILQKYTAKVKIGFIKLFERHLYTANFTEMKYSYLIFVVFLLSSWSCPGSTQQCKMFWSCGESKDCSGCNVPLECFLDFGFPGDGGLCLPGQITVV